MLPSLTNRPPIIALALGAILGLAVLVQGCATHQQQQGPGTAEEYAAYGTSPYEGQYYGVNPYAPFMFGFYDPFWFQMPYYSPFSYVWYPPPYVVGPRPYRPPYQPRVAPGPRPPRIRVAPMPRMPRMRTAPAPRMMMRPMGMPEFRGGAMRIGGMRMGGMHR